MPKVKLSKTSLQQQRTQMKLYQKLLPSLDLKRRQLMVELRKAETALGATRREIESIRQRVAEDLPMLAVPDGMDLEGLVRIDQVHLGKELVAGVKVPRLDGVEWKVAPYSLLAKPAWVDRLVERLQEAAEQRLRVSVCERRVEILTQAVRRTTQRMNLFERILIPRAKENIKRIQIYLGELERQAVIRSKLAKAKHG